MARLSFREQVLRAREDAIVAAAHRLLAQKGFDLMTVDEVAADVGVAKASLYKHFASKEDLAAAAMSRLLQQALNFLDTLAAGTPMAQLRAAAHWALQMQLAGQMPALPAQHSPLRAALAGHAAFCELLSQLAHRLRPWVCAAQAEAQLNPALPPDVVLQVLLARVCDPVPGLLKAAGHYSDAQLNDWLLSTWFDGLQGPRASTAIPSPPTAADAPHFRL